MQKKNLNQKIMTPYKHTQVGYLMLVVTLVVLVLFVGLYTLSSVEPSSIDSGPNLVIIGIMALILLILASFAALTTSIDEKSLRIKFGCGIFTKTFPLSQIASVQSVKNRWYYGWGVKVWFWPYMWIYNVSGFDAVEVIMRNGDIYRIGTDVPSELETAIKQAMNT